MSTNPELLDAVHAWYAAGFCVIPTKRDGSKAPLVAWTDYQSVRPTSAQMSEWFYQGEQHGAGVLCGRVSGNLEMLELEGAAVDEQGLERVQAAVDEAGIGDLWELLMDGYSEWTPSGGLHLLYRVSDHEVPGNTKLARRPKRNDELKGTEITTRSTRPDAVFLRTLAETRGEGGFVVVAPSGGDTHPSGNPWTRGHLASYGEVPTITWEQRCAVHVAVTKALDEVPARPELPRTPPVDRPAVGTTGRVGDDFNAKAEWPAILEPMGWRVAARESSGEIKWRKPGSSDLGHHATTGRGHGAEDRLYVFATGTIFQAEVPYSKFAAYTELYHHGDFKASVKDLAGQGYGEQRRIPAPRQEFGSLPVAVRPPGPAADQFYVADEPVAHVQAAFEAGVKGHTAPAARYLPEPGRESYTDVGTANRFMRENPHRFLWHIGDEEWLWFDGVIWQRDATKQMVALAVEELVDRMDDEGRVMLKDEDATTARMGDALCKYVKSARMNSGRKGLLATIAAKLSIDPKSLDPHLHLLGLRNGVLDVRTGEVLMSRPEWLITKQMNVHYDPAATAPKTRAYMAQVLPDAAIRDFVQRGIGYTMTGEQDQRAFFICYGIKGTGKSQFVELWGKMFGSYATVAADAAFRKRSRSDGPSAELHALRGYRFVWASESDEDVVFDADIVKRVCGGESMSTRTLYEKKPSNWRPECVVWLATNNFPRFPADEEAVWDRVKPIQFPVVFKRNTTERISSIGDLLYGEEAPGILNMMIEWLKAYRERGLVEPGEVLDAIEERIVEGDPVAQFWAEMTESGEIVADADKDIDTKALYMHYSNWTRETLGASPRGSRRFYGTLRVLLKYDKMVKRNGRSYLPGYDKKMLNGFAGSM